MTASSRRQRLIEKMQTLEQQGMGCRGCQGNCCTFEANSMMITPIEAMDLMQYLREQSLLTPELWQKCQATIKQYRLGLGVGNGKRSFLRRTYTCPFFAGAEFGCPLPREIKPYGCLAFNSHHPTLKASEHCFSDTALLEELPSASATEFPQLNWEKLSIPEAIIACWEINFADQ